MFRKLFSFCLIKVTKDDADIYSTDNRRIPQNVMSAVVQQDWFSKQDRFVTLTMYPVFQGKIIHGEF